MAESKSRRGKCLAVFHPTLRSEFKFSRGRFLIFLSFGRIRSNSALALLLYSHLECTFCLEFISISSSSYTSFCLPAVTEKLVLKYAKMIFAKSLSMKRKGKFEESEQLEYTNQKFVQISKIHYFQTILFFPVSHSLHLFANNVCSLLYNHPTSSNLFIHYYIYIDL